MDTLDHGDEEQTDDREGHPLTEMEVPQEHRDQSPNLTHMEFLEVEIQGAGVLALHFHLEKFPRDLDPIDYPL